ncbi:MAG: hypothetical protein J6I85_02890 [Clostridia bacterium]|nr:hypothetical protein [Clostridia bacterium]
MSNKIEFLNVLKTVKETFTEELAKYPAKAYNKDIIIDTDHCFRVIIEWEKCIGELVVEKPEFAPYRYVSFSVLSSVTDEITSIFSWLDSINDSLEMIKDKIREGLLIGYTY